MLGAFLALDLFLFYVFWEVMLVPMYFIIGIWGGPRRIYAAVKFVLYTMIGSLLMLVAILYLAWQYQARERPAELRLGSSTTCSLPLATQRWLFAAFALAFAIKVPMFPLHTWLPDAHVEAPTGGSVDPGRRAAEDGHLRLPALRDAAVPGGGGGGVRR